MALVGRVKLPHGFVLFYGNIELTEYDTFPCAEYKEALKRISRNEEKL